MTGIPDLAGLFGVILTLLAYGLLQFNKICAKGIFYSLANFSGSALIIYSLIFSWNMPAFVMEFTWLALSAYGMVSAIRANKQDEARP